jgi:hypothetical protein
LGRRDLAKAETPQSSLGRIAGTSKCAGKYGDQKGAIARNAFRGYTSSSVVP